MDAPDTSVRDSLANRWGSLRVPAAEWSLRVGPSGAEVRPKWIAWLGSRPEETAQGLARLYRDLGFSDVNPPADPERVRNLGVGFRGREPSCLYVILAPGVQERPDVGPTILRYGEGRLRRYRFHSFADRGPEPLLAGMAADVRHAVEALLADPVVRLRSGIWRRDGDPRVYVTFPHEPPINQLRTLLAGHPAEDQLAAFDDLHFRQVAVLGEQSGALSVYMQGAVTSLPETVQSVQAHVSFSARWYHRTAAVQRFIAEAHREAQTRG